MKAGSTGGRGHEQPKTVVEFLPGPVKIKDGLFLGDELAARDIEFIISNKVTHVINTVSRQIPNLWERFGIHYLSVNWTEKEQNIFDKKNNAVNTVFQFIEEAMEQGESCLVHSLHGKSRATSVMVAYLMQKYSWSMHKCLEFIASKKQNLQIRNNYMKQLEELQARIRQKNKLTTDWNNPATQDQILLVNTFANSKNPKNENTPLPDKRNKRRVAFQEKPVVSRIGSSAKNATSLANKETLYTPSKNKPCKSILKGFPHTEAEQKIQEFYQDEKVDKKPSSIINNINGNVVHVTVNNFIASDKKAEQAVKAINSRPFSSDQKDREKDKKVSTTLKKTLLNEPITFGSSLRSPYDMKVGTKNNSMKSSMKKETTNNRMGVNERPQSAKHRGGPYQNKGRDELMVTNGSSSYANSYQKRLQGNLGGEELFRRK